MKILASVLCTAAALVAVPAMAQDMDSDTPLVESPDGSRAFGIEPYIGVMGGYEVFDSEPVAGIPVTRDAAGRPISNQGLEGVLVQGVAGVNVPFGPLFVGAEGSVTKGISGEIDWQYGVAGRAGARVGESGLFYGKVGYQWINFDRPVTASTPLNTERDYNAMTYGIGFEVGPQEIGLGGITGQSGIRLRGEVSTFDDFGSFRPMLGVVTHF